MAVTRQGSVYWVFISKKDRLKLDERQLKVRNRVYERSYKVLPLAALVATTFSNMNSGHMRTILWLTFLIGYFAVPVIVALQQKDS